MSEDNGTRPRSKVFAQQLQSLPMEAKIVFSQKRIRQWYEQHEGMVFISYSGGKDSEVLVHLVRDLYPEVPAVFCDTGLEFPEIRAHARKMENLVIVRPEMSYKQVLETYGYPVISKRMAQYIREARSAGPESNIYRLRTTGIRTNGTMSPMGALSKKWRWLADNKDIPISDKCCLIMKKRPLAKYTKESGRVPYIGLMAGDSSDRLQSWIGHGCNYIGKTMSRSSPMMPWLEKDVWEYLKTRNVPYCPVYDMGYKRTGCIFCGFGVHLEKSPNRFQLLRKTHPQLWKYCMEKLGLREALIKVYKGKVETGDCDLFHKEED